jgi:N-acetylmuramoyl-L-alanine amidase
MLKKIDCPSPNFERRSPDASVDLIVLHYTDMRNAEEALARLCDAEAKVSAHFLIHKKGTLYQLVDPAYCAWHAGVSSWQGETDINNRSIGIELDNFGHTFGLEPFSSPQINTLVDLLDHLTKTYAIPPHRVVGHSDVAPLRKSDPGEMFPWVDLARKGFGLWPFEAKSAPQLLPFRLMDNLEIQSALSDIGYECPQTGFWDENTQKICRAFQRHFTPHELTGYPSDVTCEVLQALRKVVKDRSFAA